MPYVLVLISVAIFAVSTFAQNRTIKAGGDFAGVFIINNLPFGALLMLWCALTLPLGQISLRNWILIGVTNVLWNFAGFYRTRSYNDIDTSTARILGTFRLVLLSLAGILIFKEQLTIFNVTGVIITLAAILYTIDFKSVTITRGAKDCLVGAIFGAGAVIIVKHLSTQVPVLLIAASDFFLPGLFMYLITRKARAKIISAATANRNVMLIVAPLSLLSYILYLCAFAMGGELIVISILQQTGLFMVLGIEYYFLRFVPNFQRRCVAGALCSVGAVLVTAF